MSRGGRFELTIRLLVPAAAALTLVAVLTGERSRVDYELQLIAPDATRAGSSLPLRARLYGDLRAARGARLLGAPVRVELRGPAGTLGRGDLRPGYGTSMEGVLGIPQDSPPRLWIRAQVVGPAFQGVVVEKPLRVAPDAVAVPGQPRRLRALSSFQAGPTRASPGQVPPSALAVQIAGGACVPERRCRAVVHVGEPAASVRVSGYPALTPDGPSSRPSAPTAGIVRLNFVTHGPEAELRLVVERGAIEVARRTVRLPVALGASALEPADGLLQLADEPDLRLADAGGCIVDAYGSGLWQRTGTLSQCALVERLPFAPLGPGLWRLQLRRDPFAADSAAVRMVHVGQPSQSPAAVLAELARAVLAQEPSDLFAHGVAQEPERYAASALEASAYLLAALESTIRPQPQPVSSLPQAVARLAERRSKLRNLALLVLLLSGMSLALLVARRGLRASEQAERIMQAAGASHAQSGRARLRATLTVLLAVASLSLAFVAIAMYVIARG